MRAKIDSSSPFKMFLVLCLGLIIFLTCSKKSPVTHNSYQVCPILCKVDFADAFLSDLIQKVVLTVTLDEADTSIQRDLVLQDGRISGSLEVPAGRDRIFKLEALDRSNAVIYRGVDTVTVIGGRTNEVKITLIPVPEIFLLKLDPIYQAVSRSDSCLVAVKLHNASGVFGVSFRVEFDPAVLCSANVSPGDFLGDSTIFLAHVDTLGGYVAVGYSRTHGNGSGVTGNGTLAQMSIFFKPSSGETIGGSTSVNLAFNRQTLTFYRQDGESQGLKDSVYIHDAQVLIR